MLRLLDTLLVERCVSASTAKAWRTVVTRFLRWAGAGCSPQIACDRLSEFVAWRATWGSAYTASFYRRTMLSILRMAEDHGLCRLPHRVRRVKLPEIHPRGFTDVEVRLLLCFASPIQRAAIMLVRYGAPRRGDVFRVRWPQVGEDGVLRWTMGKSGRRHAVYLPPVVIEACRAARVIDDDRLVPFRYTMSSWAKAWQKLGQRAGVDVKDRGLQALRRTAASLVGREHGESEAARLLGHANGSGVNVYRQFYRIGEFCDRPPPSPPPLEGD